MMAYPRGSAEETPAAEGFSLGCYLALSLIIVPLMGPLRSTGVLEPATLRNLLLPPLMLFMVAAFGAGRVIRPRAAVQIVLLVVFLQAMVRGFANGTDPATMRNYWSHLFQIASAYLMFGIGWIAIRRVGHKYWRLFAMLALLATLVSTTLTLGALDRGEVSRLYTPAYGFVFVTAFSAIYSAPTSAFAVLGSMVSNKRGPILAVVALFALHAFTSIRDNARTSLATFLKTVLVLSAAVGVVAVGVLSTLAWAEQPVNAGTPVGRALNITHNRISDLLAYREAVSSLEEISAGRIGEIEATVASLDAADYVIGAGAGWLLEIDGVKRVQNIHFTPLSLTAVFGAPFAIYIYGFLIALVVRGSLRKDTAGLTTSERMAPLYLAGALVHSLTAYSLFIDLMVFFFAGLLAHSLQRVKMDSELGKGLGE